MITFKMEIMLQCILNVFDEEERIHIFQAEEAEEIAFAGICGDCHRPSSIFSRGILMTLLSLSRLFALRGLVKFTSPICVC